MTKHALACLLFALTLGGCGLTDSSADFEPEVVVESYQVVDEPLAEVRVSRTVPVNATYNFGQTAVAGATVRVDLLAADGTVEATYPYRAVEPGVYVPEDDARVLPLRTYRLTVETADERAEATTLTPGRFDVLSTGREEVVFQGADQFEVQVTRSSYPGRQNIFVFSTEALDASADNLTPFYFAALDEDGDDVIDDEEAEELVEFITTSSPPLNEANYDLNPDGSLTIRLPWLAVAFYGRLRVTASAIDDNLYDFIRSQGVQQGGSTLAPGEIPNVIDHVEGGRGVFASYARVAQELTVLRF